VNRSKLLALVFALATSVAAAQTDQQLAKLQEHNASLRKTICAEQDPANALKPFPPEIGCVTIAAGGQASGNVDGHHLDIAVAADGTEQCRVDGTVISCNGCAGPKVTGCPESIMVIPNTEDHSVTFSFQRKMEGDRYAYSMNAWKAYLERKKNGTLLQVETAPVARPPPPTPPAALAAPPVIPAPPPGAFFPGREATDGPAALTAVGWIAQGAYSRSQWADLESLVNTLSTPDQLTDDGMPKLAGVIEGINDFVTAWNQWDDDFARIAKWRREQPDSPTIDVVEALVWRAWAWKVRGGGYGNTVKAEAWKLFTTKIGNASTALERCKSASCQTPLWYQLRLGIARDAGWDPDRYRQLFEEARKKYPWYIPLYLWAANYLSPQWGGSYEAVDAFARQTVTMPPGTDYSLYARIYWHIRSYAELDFEIFRDSPANWSDMKKGFEALMKQYPKSMWNLNAYASFACHAQDRETYGELRAKIARNVFPEAWSSNATVDVCDEQLLGKS